MGEIDDLIAKIHERRNDPVFAHRLARIMEEESAILERLRRGDARRAERAAAAKYEVLLRLDPADGNEPIEASTFLPCIPRKGDMIEVWVAHDEHPDPENPHRQPIPAFLDVDYVVLCTYAPERVEVWVKYEGFDLAEVRRIFEAIARNEQP